MTVFPAAFSSLSEYSVPPESYAVKSGETLPSSRFTGSSILQPRK